MSTPDSRPDATGLRERGCRGCRAKSHHPPDVDCLGCVCRGAHPDPTPEPDAEDSNAERSSSGEPDAGDDGLYRFLYSNGDGGIWESFDAMNAVIVANAVLASDWLAAAKAQAAREALREAADWFDQYDEVYIGRVDIGSNLIPVDPATRLRERADQIGGPS